MEIAKSTILSFNGHGHRLRAVLGGWDQYPVVDIPSSEINDLTVAEFVPHVSPEVDTGLKVLFFKQKGKYTVLVGREIVSAMLKGAKQFTISGRLISTPALKSARAVDDVEEVSPTAPAVVAIPAPRVYPRNPTGPIDRNGDVKVRPRNTFLRHRAK